MSVRWTGGGVGGGEGGGEGGGAVITAIRASKQRIQTIVQTHKERDVFVQEDGPGWRFIYQKNKTKLKLGEMAERGREAALTLRTSHVCPKRDQGESRGGGGQSHRAMATEQDVPACYECQKRRGGGGGGNVSSSTSYPVWQLNGPQNPSWAQNPSIR